MSIDVEEWLGAPALSYVDRPRTILDVLDGAVANYGGRQAFVDWPRGYEPGGGVRPPARSVTWAEFAELVEGAVQRLGEEGLEAGDRLAVALHNSLDLAVALFACARGGFVMVGLNVRLRAAQWAYQMAHSDARMALASDDLFDELELAAAEAELKPKMVRRIGDHLVGGRRPWTYSVADRPDQDATFAVVYTSGTTGRPKASQVVHRASVHSGMTYQRVLGLNGEDRTAVLFALSYISALHAHVLPMAMTGGACILIGSTALGGYLDVLESEQITWMYTVPSMWLRLLRSDRFTSKTLPSLRLGAAGGAPFPTSELEAIRTRFPNLGLVNIYGLTETHSPATMLLPSEWDDVPTSVGRALPCMEAKVVDDHGRQLPVGEAGELWLRGSLVTTGYAGDAPATQQAIVDGWFHTGDVARIDGSGYVYILDRMKDMINRGGHKLYSVEIEQLLLGHPAIAEAAVLGIPDRTAGEAVACWVVPADGQTLRVRDVRKWVNEHMADYAVPRHVEIVAELPYNATGKVDKAMLREQMIGGA